MVFWLVDASIDVVIFGENKSMLESIFSPDDHELYMRGIVLVLFGITSVITRHFMLKQEATARELQEHRNNLQDIVNERTAQLEKLATIDDLTQVYNRRKLYEIAETEFERSARYHQALSLIIIDIDFFKKINDTLGHDTGDKTLKTLSRLISGIIRKTDSLGRIGGEEFAVILPVTDLSAAKELAERIRSSVEKAPFPDVEKVTISVGVTQCIENDKVLSLFKRADVALYAAKNDGRNRVVCA